MTSAATLFGIPLTALYAAIASVESKDGLKSPNVYQIREIYVQDCNRIAPTSSAPYNHSDCLDRAKSEQMMLSYWRYYGNRYTHLTGLTPTAEVLARIHNGGPDGWRKPCTAAYWDKVSSLLR